MSLGYDMSRDKYIRGQYGKISQDGNIWKLLGRE